MFRSRQPVLKLLEVPDYPEMWQNEMAHLLNNNDVTSLDFQQGHVGCHLRFDLPMTEHVEYGQIKT